MSRLKKVLPLALFASLIAAFAVYEAAYIPVRVIGPYYRSQASFDSATGAAVGGMVQTYLAADSLRVGQIVYTTVRNTVDASATLTAYNAITGVVVGGTRTGMQASVNITDTSTLAATAGQRVVVLRQGRFWVLDSTGAINPGIAVRPSGTKGRMAAQLNVPDTFHRVFGRMVDTASSGKAGLVDINIIP